MIRETQLKGQELDTVRDSTLSANISGSRSKITEQIQQAYSIVVTVSDKNEIQAFKITLGSDNLFAAIKADSRSRIQDTDYAKETASLTRAQILQQAASAVVAQANAVPRVVLQLLR